MMENSTQNFSRCAHCGGQGTCTAENSNSCGTCIKQAKIKNDSKIVVCFVCNGVGCAEPKTVKMKRRIPYLIVSTILLTFYVYAAISAIMNINTFDRVFPVIGSLTTMIVTFYFSQKN